MHDAVQAKFGFETNPPPTLMDGWFIGRVARLSFQLFKMNNAWLKRLNNGNDNLATLPINQPSIKVGGGFVSNPNFACTASCINPSTGLYLGANGQALTLSN